MKNDINKKLKDSDSHVTDHNDFTDDQVDAIVVRPAHKAAKTHKLNRIQEFAVKRLIVVGGSFGATIVHIKESSPEMFVGITTKDLENLASKMGYEHARNRL